MQILIIEDEIRLAESLKRGLEQSDFSVFMIHDGEQGLAEIEANYSQELTNASSW